MATFSTVVDLYRESPNAIFDGRSFSATVELTPRIATLIRELNISRGTCGKLEDIEVDEEIIDIDEHPNLSGSTISYTFVPVKNGAERFYKNKDDFLQINSIRKGVIPAKYFIADINLFSQDEILPDFIFKIERICSIIKSLSEIAHFHDTKSELTNYRLVFVKNSDAKSTSIVLETSFNDKMLDNEIIDDTILKEFVTLEPSRIPHYAEKIGTFRNTLVEFISEKNLTFSDLINQWPSFLKLFENNLSTYMSGFSFHKARKEVATAEADFAEKISKIITDLTSKVLSLPLSLIASLGIFKLSSTYEMLVVLSGVFLTSLFIYMTLINQEKQLIRIVHAKNLVFKPFNSQSLGYPEDLKTDISDALHELNDSQRSCHKTIKWLMFLSWVPSSIATGVYLSKIF